MKDIDRKFFLSNLTKAILLARNKDFSNAAQLLYSLSALLANIHSEWAEEQKCIIKKIQVRYGVDTLAPLVIESCIGQSIDEFSRVIMPGVSLITCCMNRSENLLKAIPTWLQCPEINQIIVVDWSSKESVRSEILAAGINDSRILVARVNNQPRWILSYAYNLGFRIAGYDKILKTDADIQISSRFFEENPLRFGTFLSGDWRTAKKGQEHINGFFFVRRDDLLSIKGFNEYITTYGWDDDDIYFRLEQHGFNRVRIKADGVYHIPHDDVQRVGNAQPPHNALEELRQDTGAKIMGNRFLAGAMPIWNKDRIFLPFVIRLHTSGYLEVEQNGESYHQVAPHIRADADYYGLVSALSWTTELTAFEITKKRLYKLLSTRRCRAEITRADIRLAACNTTDDIDWYQQLLIPSFSSESSIDEQVQVAHLLYEKAQEFEFTILLEKTIFEKLSIEQEGLEIKFVKPVPVGFHTHQIPVCTLESLKNIRKIFATFPAAVIDLEKCSFSRILSNRKSFSSRRQDRLYIHVQHGLGNRLRALASATVIAEATSRELVLIWSPDHHCECEIHDLFDYTGTVIVDRAGVDISDVDQFNYMEIEPDSCKDGYIALVPGRDAYIKSAYALNNEHTSWEKENVVLRSLSVVKDVMDLVQSVSSSGRLGVHVRMEGARGSDHNIYDSAQNWSAESHRQLNEWRGKSHYSNFMMRIDSLIQQQPCLEIFLAADRPETYEVFAARYGKRLSFLKRECFGRSREQLLYALADAILLSQCAYMLGSTWSSFSELAQRLSLSMQKIEMSGIDF